MHNYIITIVTHFAIKSIYKRFTAFEWILKMPKKTKRQRQLTDNAKKARESVKVPRLEVIDEELPLTASGPSGDADDEGSPDIRGRSVSTDPTDDDPTFDPDDEISNNPNLKLERFVEEWVVQLDRDNKISFGLFLMYNLQHVLNFTSTNSAEYAAIMMGTSERTLRQWRSDFVDNGEVLENKQGRYQHSGLLWSNEELNRKATKFIRENANVKGQPNLTSAGFCSWVNEELLPNKCLEPGFPRKISVKTARVWMHLLGFEVLSASKGAYFDGHEREDVVKQREEFLKKMIEVGYIHPEQAPTPEAQRAFPNDAPLASSETREKAAVIFHDESTFNANDDQGTQWGVKGEGMLRPKSKGSGIMVSDFIDERNGFLALDQNEFEEAQKSDITITQQARETLEYGESREGYWTSEKFMLQMNNAVKIADIKYPREEGWNVVWVFDHSSCHTAMAEDALDASKMNVKPGGKQPVMRATIWAGKVQEMTFALGVPKGMKQVLEERGIRTESLKAEDMRKILSNHEDFRNEKPKVMEEKGYTALILPKFHPELNPIERVWGQAKRYSKSHCNYSLPSLRKVIDPALDSVTLENIIKFNRKARDYMFAYFEGIQAGPNLDKQIKLYRSHRRVGKNS